MLYQSALDIVQSTSRHVVTKPAAVCAALSSAVTQKGMASPMLRRVATFQLTLSMIIVTPHDGKVCDHNRALSADQIALSLQLIHRLGESV